MDIKQQLSQLATQQKNWSAEDKAEAFLDAMDSDHLADLSKKAHIMLWTIIAVIICFFIWTAWAQVDEITRGSGKVIPSSKTQIIQHYEGGIIEEILVKVGQVVTKNQPLMTVDNTQFDASYRESLIRAASLETKIARLQAQISDEAFTMNDNFINQFPKLFRSEQILLKANQTDNAAKKESLIQRAKQVKQELAATKAKKRQLDRTLSFAKQELEMNRALLSEGATSQVEVLRLERDVNNIDGELRTTKLNIPKVEQMLAEAHSKINELETEMKRRATEELTKVKSELAQMSENNRILADRSSRTVIKSPVNGSVNIIHVNTVGGVIQPGMPIIEIVPTDGTLLVEAKIQPADVAFLRLGLPALVKVSAYDYVVFGGIEGKLELISPDTIQDEQGNAFYTIHVRTNQNYLEKGDKKLYITPGMQAQIDIVTGRKSVLAYFVRPLIRVKTTAFTER